MQPAVLALMTTAFALAIGLAATTTLLTAAAGCSSTSAGGGAQDGQVDAAADAACGSGCAEGLRCLAFGPPGLFGCFGAPCGDGGCPAGQACSTFTFDPCPVVPGRASCNVASTTELLCAARADAGAE